MLEHFVSTGASLAQWSYMLTGFYINIDVLKNIMVLDLLDIIKQQADVSVTK